MWSAKLLTGTLAPPSSAAAATQEEADAASQRVRANRMLYSEMPPATTIAQYMIRRITVDVVGLAQLRRAEVLREVEGQHAQEAQDRQDQGDDAGERPRPVGSGPCEWARALSLSMVFGVFMRAVRVAGHAGASLD